MGHSQIKPLTEEEKAEKLKELREKMAAKRAKKAEEELKEQKVNENLRRKSGKVRLIRWPICGISPGSTME